jgi:phosphoadenosine phosphosulfate reductase
MSEKQEYRRILPSFDLEAMEEFSAHQILTWGIKNFHPKLALSASFGAPEGMVLLDMMHRIEPTSRVFVLDTGRLHAATHDLIDRVRDHYDIQVEVVPPDGPDLAVMLRERGMNLFHESVENRKLCCRIRKVEPMRRFVSGLDAYVSGLRRDQNLNRQNTPKVELDVANGNLLKLNPLADWTRSQVMDYAVEHGVPTNRLHKEGFPSVGCEPCTRERFTPVRPSARGDGGGRRRAKRSAVYTSRTNMKVAQASSRGRLG